AYGIGEGLVAAWQPDLGRGIAGGALAFAVLAASVAGPAAPWIGSLGARVLAGAAGPPLSDWGPPAANGARATPAAPGVDRVLVDACAAVRGRLRLDGCRAL